MVVRKVWQKDNGATMLTASGILLEGKYIVSKSAKTGAITLTFKPTDNGN